MGVHALNALNVYVRLNPCTLASSHDFGHETWKIEYQINYNLIY